MKTILCYGDSNTYGYNPATGFRYDPSLRWAGRLRQLLPEEYTIIEEGCNGRTALSVPADEPWKNGNSSLKACLNSHKPIDLVILMLGTNDLKTVYAATAEELAASIRSYAEEIKAFTLLKQLYAAQVLIVSPPALCIKALEYSSFAGSFDLHSEQQSLLFPALYRQVAEETGSLFLDAAACTTTQTTDGLHLGADSHINLAEAIAKTVTRHFQ